MSLVPSVTDSWMKQPERGSSFLLKLITWIALRLGRPVARTLLYPITFYFLATTATAVAASRDFLGRSLQRRATFADVFWHYHSFAATILDRVYLLSGQVHRFDVRIENGDMLKERVAAGEGCILLGSHLGSFEILRALGVREKHFPIRVLMDVRQNPVITRLLDSLSPEVAKTVIPAGGLASLLRVKESIEKGYLVGILGDRFEPGQPHQICPFLGGKAGFPTGPLKLATKIGAPVFLFFGLYLGGNRYDIRFEPLICDPDLPSNTDPKAIAALTCQFARRLEHYTRAAPYNWFNFYDYWKGNSSDCHADTDQHPGRRG